jgi:hypothetical protein
MKLAIFAFLFGIFSIHPQTGFAQTIDHNSVYRKLLKKPYPGGQNEAWEYASKIPEWDLKKMRGLCMFVDSKEQDPNPQGRFVFKYQRKILEAARIDPIKESEEQIAAKVRKMWNENEELFICNNTKFDVANGNIIKFAVNLKFDEFMIDMAHWGINLNRVDEMDGRTVLDYIQAQIERNKGLPQEPVLKGYYRMVRKAGARHKFEI